MAQRLHPVFGGRSEGPQARVFRDRDRIDVAGILPGHAPARDASGAGRRRLRIAPPHRPGDEGTAALSSRGPGD